MLLSVAFFILCVGIGFGCSEITARKASEMLKRESVPEQTKTKYKPETKIVESEVSEETASKDDTEDMAEDKMSEDVQTETVVSEEMKRMAEDFLICIDPGHYASQNYVEDGENSYAEGDFTLELAKELAAVLKEEYGIPSVLTRDSGSITLGGYTDGALDRGHISLRGSYAAGCKLFLSLHTNANLDGANGYATCSQPIEITKPILVVNETACSTPYALDIANKVGEHLAKTGLELGIATIGEFQKAKKTEELKAWTDAENDRLSTPNRLCQMGK